MSLELRGFELRGGCGVIFSLELRALSLERWRMSLAVVLRTLDEALSAPEDQVERAVGGSVGSGGAAVGDGDRGSGGAGYGETRYSEDCS